MVRSIGTMPSLGSGKGLDCLQVKKALESVGGNFKGGSKLDQSYHRRMVCTTNMQSGSSEAILQREIYNESIAFR